MSLFQKLPFFHTNIEALISDPWVTYFNITGASGNNSFTNLPINNIYGQYIMILSTNDVPLFIDEVDIYGESVDFRLNGTIVGPRLSIPYGDGGPWIWPNDPPIFPKYVLGPPFVWIGPNGTIVWPWWSSQEICNDGIDNDGNGLTDCEDYPCGVGTFNVVQTNPTCPICQNGRICIYANNNVNQVSIDNGITWNTFPITGFFCFEKLNSGAYQVKLRTIYKCEEGKDVTLISPLGENELCLNGGFESGTFNNWSGGIASGYSTNFNNTTLDINNRHTIQLNSFVDPYAPFITGMQGTFCAKLGNNTAGSESERLRYCFIVNNSNSNLSFNYATVLEIPNHNNNFPFFEYKIFKRTDGSIIGHNRIDTDHPYLVKPGIIGALGWDCVATDLSAFIGQEVCVEFISSDCGCGAHFGYGYVDGICSMGGNNINVSLSSKNIFCGNQPIGVDVVGVGYNQYKWTVSKIDASGNEYDKYNGPIQNGFQANILDVKQFYEENTNYSLTCPQKVKVKFEGFSGCGSGGSEIVLDYKCPEYNVDYCNPFYYCISNNVNQLQIQGINNCENCTYNWSSSQGLSGMINTTSKFPILDRSLNILAFDRLYNVEVQTPEGCKYEDSFKAQSGASDINITNIEYGYCAYKVSGNLTFDTPVDINDVSMLVKNTINNQMIPFIISGGGLVYNFEFSVSRNSPSLVRIDIEYILSNCSFGNCSKTISLAQIGGPPHSQWKAKIPNVFTPNGDGVNDDFYLQFRSVNENRTSCSDINWTNSSVFSYRLEIFDRWGNLFFDKTISNDILDIQGILGDEIKWDGKFNGQTVVPGTYTWKATVQSCYNGSNQCNDCIGGNNNFDKCGTSGYEIFAGDITVVL